MQLQLSGIWLLLCWAIPTWVGLARLFRKAGIPSWAAWLPGYRSWLLLQHFRKPRWWLFWALFPPTTLALWAQLLNQLLWRLGYKSWLSYTLSLLTTPLALPILAWSLPSHTPPPQSSAPNRARAITEQLTIVFLLATTAITFGVQTFYIPSNSMEGTLLEGDYILVDKTYFGPRIPQSIPFGPAGPFIKPLIQWGSKGGRLPGRSSISRGNVLVFHLPSSDQLATSFRPPYVKRCMALPGDTLRIDSAQVLVNNHPLPKPLLAQWSFFAPTNSIISEKVFEKAGFNAVKLVQGGYIVFARPNQIDALRKLPIDGAPIPQFFPKGSPLPRIYPNPQALPWNIDHYGPYVVPHKGMSIAADTTSLIYYLPLIRHMEGWDEVTLAEDNTLWINGRAISQYTFQQDYYFMIGDNRHDSFDSRYWGPVPASHLIGKASHIWWSRSPEGKIRWSRLGQRIQ